MTVKPVVVVVRTTVLVNVKVSTDVEVVCAKEADGEAVLAGVFDAAIKELALGEPEEPETDLAAVEPAAAGTEAVTCIVDVW